MMQTYPVGGVGPLVSKVELRIACRNLASLDYLSQSDPIVRVKQFRSTTGKWIEVGRTEWQRNQKNPSFARSVPIDYYFEQVQKLRFQVYDVDNPDGKLKKQDFIGEMVITLGEILGSKGSTVSRELTNPHHARRDNTIIVQAEEVNAEAANSIITFRFAGTKLDKKDLFGKSDPFLEIYRSNLDGNFVLVHKTEVIKKTLDPSWHPFELDASKLCQGDFDRKLLLKVWDWDADGSSDLIGVAETTLNEMLKGKRAFQLIEPSRVNKKGYTNSGTLHLHQVDLRRVHSFLEYISGGCQLRLAVAIDYTASNGNPTDPSSLHYRNPSGEPNEYLKAIMAIGDIVAAYDQTKQYPTYGFGARVPPTNDVSHCFHVNMDPTNPECIGIEGVISAYQSSLGLVKLSGPTNFATIIKQVATIARQAPIQQQVYWVLLMLTDGAISDLEQTINEMVDASSLPLSIIIVGVGSADFADMNALDSDNRLLRSKTGKTAARDIVQFVPFRNFKQKHYSELASATLAELPKQLTDYYKAHNIAPRPRPVMPMTQMGLQAPMTGMPGAGLQAPPTGAPGLSAPQGGPGGAPPQQWGGPQGGPPPQQGGPQGGPPPQAAPPAQHPGGWEQQGGPTPQQGGWAAPQGGSAMPSASAAAQPAAPKQGEAPQQPQGGAPQAEPQQQAGQHQQWGAPPQQQGGWGAPPQQQAGGWGAPPQQGGWGAPPQQQWGAPPQQQGGWGAPQQQWGAPPQQQGGGWGAPPQQYGWGAPPQQGGWGAPPQQQGGWGAPPPQQWGGPQGGPPQQGGYGAQSGWTGGAPPAQTGQGPAPPQGGAPPQ